MSRMFPRHRRDDKEAYSDRFPTCIRSRRSATPRVRREEGAPANLTTESQRRCVGCKAASEHRSEALLPRTRISRCVATKVEVGCSAADLSPVSLPSAPECAKQNEAERRSRSVLAFGLACSVFCMLRKRRKKRYIPTRIQLLQSRPFTLRITSGSHACSVCDDLAFSFRANTCLLFAILDWRFRCRVTTVWRHSVDSGELSLRESLSSPLLFS